MQVETKCISDLSICHMFDSIPKNLGLISPKIFIHFFVNSNSNLIQTQMLTLELFPNRTLILTPKKANEISVDEYLSFSFYSFNLKIFGVIVTTKN